MNLDLEQVNALPPEHRNRYLQLEKLFAQPGWKIVVALAQANATQSLQQAALAPSWDANRLAIGNHMAWRTIANLEKDTQTSYAEMAATAGQAAELRQINDEHEFE